MSEQILVPLENVLDNPYQPRLVDDADHIRNLALSIAQDDLLQKPSARPVSGGMFELAFGHSRRRAFEYLLEHKTACAFEPYKGWKLMPVIVESLSDEQMYRHAVAENVQRKDLDPIETARAMKRYMEEFGATSKAAGELFGMSDATVRGKVRLLDLPAAAQDKLSSGAISEGTARQLLSIQKIATEKDIVETIKRIEKNEDHELPEQIIERAVDGLENTIEMWTDDGRGGKPRSDRWGARGWLLDMKNFPNELLPDLSVIEAADAIGIAKSDKKNYDILKDWMFGSGADEKQTPEEAWGELKAAGLDEQVIERLRHLYNPPACTACPYYTKIRGSHYCGVKFCHERKTEAWHKSVLRAASKKLGMPLYQENDGKYVALETYTPSHKTLFEKRHKDLRLIPKGQLGDKFRYSSQRFDGADGDVFFIVAVGETATRLLAQSQSFGGRLKGTAVDRTAQRQAKLYRTLRKELIWEFCAGAKSMFDGLTRDVLQELVDWKYVGVDDRPPGIEGIDDRENAKIKDMEEAEYLRHLLVWMLVNEQTELELKGFSGGKLSVAKVAKELEGFAKGWNMKSPRNMTKKAEQFDAEIAAISTVAVETKNKKK